MKNTPSILLLSVVCVILGLAPAVGEPWPGNTPVVEPQTDGTIYLNAEAAGFVLQDKMGSHLMNAERPLLKIENGRLTHLYLEGQLPYWRLQVPEAGQYLVVINASTENAEDCVLRLDFKQAAAGSGFACTLHKGAPGSGVQTFVLGEIKLAAGDTSASTKLNFWKDYNRLPEIQDVRLIPVRSTEAMSAYADLVRRSPVLKSPSIEQLDQQIDSDSNQLNQLSQDSRAKPDYSTFTDYSQFLKADSLRGNMDRLNAELTRLRGELDALQRKTLLDAREAMDPKDQAILDQVIAEENAQRVLETQPYKKTIFAATVAQDPPLFPTGDLDKLPMETVSPGAKVVRLDVPPPDDAEARRKAFAERNSPAGLESLCRQLHAAIRPSVKGLEEFESDFQAGQYDKALDAYRAYFFRRLKKPEDYGADGIEFYPQFFRDNGKANMARRPDPDLVKENLAGTATLPAGNTLYEMPLGEPGSVNWAPADLQPPAGVAIARNADSSPYWKTPEGVLLHQKIDFFRALNRLPTTAANAMFPDLFYSYLITGNRDHLKLFTEYLEDWTMNNQKDLDNCPVDIRAATELEIMGWFIPLLRTTLDERPEFATDFPAPALARMMLFLTETYYPYIIRAKRAELANWGIMGTWEALNETKLFNEFRSMADYNREFVRLARIDWIQHLSLDGEDLEAWDEGHIAIDLEMEKAPTLSLDPAPVMGDLEKQAYLDNVKVAERALVTHFSPDGNYWVPWLPEWNRSVATINGKLLRRSLLDDVIDEPVVATRIDHVEDYFQMDRTPPLSDVQPYAAMYDLRDGWGGDSNYFIMQNFPARSQCQAWSISKKSGGIVASMRTEFSVARRGRALLSGSAVVVDSKPPNRWVDAIHSGGKTDFSMATPRNVQPTRFYSSATFNVAEALQDSPYRRYDYSNYADALGLSQTTPDDAIRDVRDLRQVFNLCGEGVYIVADRIENPGAEHEYSKYFLLPVRVSPEGAADRLRLFANQKVTLLEIDPAHKRARSGNPGFENVSLYLAGHDYEWGGRSLGPGTYEKVGSVTAEDILARSSKGTAAAMDLAVERSLEDASMQVVSARWKGAGNQADVSVVFTRKMEADPSQQFAGDLVDFQEMNGADGISGSSFKTPAGTEVWFQMAANKTGQLVAGPGSAVGGSLLVTRRDGVLRGVLLDAQSVALNGKTFQGPSDSFAFELSADGKFSATPIHVPIDTTIIDPQQTVFTDTLQVSFKIPTQDTSDIEFRYTLDGSDPTLKSTLYTGPFELSSDTLVKVRPFRKGLEETPWNIAGVDGGKLVSAIFRKTPPLPQVSAGNLQPGLNYQYFEGTWMTLMACSGMSPQLAVKSSGRAASLLDGHQLEGMRQTDRAYAVKYDGFIDIPATGVYRFFAPEHLYNTTMDAGYDLRIWIDGKEWFPSPDLHAENIWSVALEKGLHRFQASYVDYRWKTFHNEYWMSWQPEQVWQGTPVLQVDGPSMAKQPLPQSWLESPTVQE